MYAKPMKYDLSKRLPNVLLIGNGVLKAMQPKDTETEDCDWEKYIVKLSESPKNFCREFLKSTPYPLLTSVIAPTDDKQRHNKYVSNFKTLKFKDDSLLKAILDNNFDAVLTTNYTYEIENHYYAKYDSLSCSGNLKFAFVTKEHHRTDPKYLMHTYNKFKDGPPIWHIHGELRRKSSIIGNHDEYIRLIEKIIAENKLIGNKYQKAISAGSSVEYNSWIDYFLMSNLYIIGFGMNYSEMDIWWLLIRRMRENAETGKIIYYEPINTSHLGSYKKNVLEKLNVKQESFGIEVTEKSGYTKELTRDFYNKIIEDIKKRLALITC